MDLRLTNLCLDSIANNFERYNLACITTNNENMKRKFEFLQRKYSHDILIRFPHSVPKEFVDVLINKYLKVLDTAWLINCSWEKTVSKFAEIGYNIEEIKFGDAFFNFEELPEETPWQDIICYLPNLKSFIFPLKPPEAVLTNLAKTCPNIEEIVITCNTLTSETIKILALFTKLKKLIFGFVDISDHDAKYLLKNLRSLETFDFPGLDYVLYTMHMKDLSHLDEVEPYNITELFIQTKYLRFANMLKVCLSLCPHLKSLRCPLKNEEEFIYFSKLCDLEKLTLVCKSNSKININGLLKSKGRKLTSVTLINCIVSISALAEYCPRVEKLYLNGTDFLFDADLKPVFNSLSSFTFVGFNVSTNAKAISLFLSSSVNLETLVFTNCNLLHYETKAQMLKWCELHPVKKISLWNSKIEKAWIKDLLLNCHTLRSLNVGECFESDDEDELSKFAENLPNKPYVDTGDDIFY